MAAGRGSGAPAASHNEPPAQVRTIQIQNNQQQLLVDVRGGDPPFHSFCTRCGAASAIERPRSRLVAVIVKVSPYMCPVGCAGARRVGMGGRKTSSIFLSLYTTSRLRPILSPRISHVYIDKTESRLHSGCKETCIAGHTYSFLCRIVGKKHRN